MNEIVTLASLVEKETGRPEDRPVVASVYENRLRKGMALDCDPTTIYAALLEQRYRGTIYRSDLASDNAYNTYRHAGLPPGPIANPGVASLKAALAPAETDYLYFVAKADGSGGHQFSETIAQHNVAVAAVPARDQTVTRCFRSNWFIIPRYDLNLGDHVFPARKYRLIHGRLLEQRFAEPADFIEPQPASDDDVLRVHDAGWVHRLKTGTLSAAEIVKLEIPYSSAMVEGFWLATGGTILAARNALRDRIGFNIGGGFHHAFPAHGEGFCAIHDVAIAIRALQHERAIEKALVVDCDVHHGNGTAAIFAGDRSVLTLSHSSVQQLPERKTSVGD